MVKMLAPAALLALIATFGSSLASAHHAAPAKSSHYHQMARRQLAPRSIPPDWLQDAAADPSDNVKFSLSLRGQNSDKLASKIAEIASEGKGNWLSDEELQHYVKPAKADTDALIKHMANHGIDAKELTWSKHGDRATLNTTARLVSKLFKQPALYRYNHKPTGEVQIKAQSLNIPSSLPFVEHVSGLTSFPQYNNPDPSFRRKKLTPQKATKLAQEAADGQCDPSGVTGTCLRQLYEVDQYKPSGQGDKLDVLIIGYQDQSVSPSDLETYLQKYGPKKTQGAKVKVLEGGGAKNDPNSPGGEAMLDVEMVSVMNYPLNNAYLFYRESGSMFADSLQYVLDQGLKPGVISVSWGGIESQQDKSSAQQLCQVAQKLTAQGTTVLFASGDNGVSGVHYEGDSCSNGFEPTYPCGCEYILGVGATRNPQTGAEVATPWSGGGFSNYFNTPKYQKQAVQGFLQALGGKNQELFNKKGRAFPDVASMGQDLAVVVGGQDSIVLGTSASCPIWAGLLSLANDARRKAGKGNIGFIHPTLYNNQDAFNDITKGQNGGCNGDAAKMSQMSRRQFGGDSGSGNSDIGPGFPAVKGYDAVTGLGTIQLNKLISILEGASGNGGGNGSGSNNNNGGGGGSNSGGGRNGGSNSDGSGRNDGSNGGGSNSGGGRNGGSNSGGSGRNDGSNGGGSNSGGGWNWGSDSDWSGFFDDSNDEWWKF